MVVLKILGLILLAVLGLVLLSLALLLFVPVRYDARVGGEGTAFTFDIKVSWLLRIVRLRYTRSPGAEADLQIRVFWFKVALGDPEDTPASDSLSSSASVSSAEVSMDTPKSGASAAASADTPAIVTRASAKDETDSSTLRPNPTANGERRGQSGGKQRRKYREKDRDDELGGVFERITGILNKIRYYKNHPDRVEITAATWRLAKQLWRASRPKKFELEGEVGFESPHNTGYLFAALGCLNLIPSGLVPSYDGKLLCAEAFMRGRISLWSVLWPLFRYAIKRPIWPITKKILLER